MKPSKRQMYRRRYVMLQDLAEQIRHSVARHTLPAKTPPRRQTTPDPRFRVGNMTNARSDALPKATSLSLRLL
jgi:hypothetical protein